MVRMVTTFSKAGVVFLHLCFPKDSSGVLAKTKVDDSRAEIYQDVKHALIKIVKLSTKRWYSTSKEVLVKSEKTLDKKTMLWCFFWLIWSVGIYSDHRCFALAIPAHQWFVADWGWTYRVHHQPSKSCISYEPPKPHIGNRICQGTGCILTSGISRCPPEKSTRSCTEFNQILQFPWQVSECLHQLQKKDNLGISGKVRLV